MKTGTVGFATVAQTRGIPAKLAAALESLSGTRGGVSGDETGSGRVAARSQTRWSIDGRRWLVFSRIVDAGLDYSGRSNLLAHHWAFDEDVDPVAFWLREDDFFRREWRDRPRLLEPLDGDSDLARTVGKPAPALPCLRWKASAGDGGWAGILASTAVDALSRAFLVANSDSDAAVFFVEAISTLDPSVRGLAMFATQSCAIPPNVEVRWRAVLPGILDRSTVVGDSNRDATIVFDLTSSVPVRGFAAPEDWIRRLGATGASSALGVAAARKGETFDPRPESVRDVRKIRRESVPGAENAGNLSAVENAPQDARFVNLRDLRSRRRIARDANEEFLKSLDLPANVATNAATKELSEYYAALAAKKPEKESEKKRDSTRFAVGVAIGAALGIAGVVWALRALAVF